MLCQLSYASRRMVANRAAVLRCAQFYEAKSPPHLDEFSIGSARFPTRQTCCTAGFESDIEAAAQVLASVSFLLSRAWIF